eukprot:TRINITY_DN2192_c0_g1_i3.p3 TRINITY_DN2192_c0_g1~~TRINITY_DN2192_c0_g1_i3.p3  ORF type:complete len:103 (-),score=0.12 TRINITY_DN2192_c0_g1_i3:44-352(-)
MACDGLAHWWDQRRRGGTSFCILYYSQATRSAAAVEDEPCASIPSPPPLGLLLTSWLHAVSRFTGQLLEVAWWLGDGMALARGSHRYLGHCFMRMLYLLAVF